MPAAPPSPPALVPVRPRSIPSPQHPVPAASRPPSLPPSLPLPPSLLRRSPPSRALKDRDRAEQNAGRAGAQAERVAEGLVRENGGACSRIFALRAPQSRAGSECSRLTWIFCGGGCRTLTPHPQHLAFGMNPIHPAYPPPHPHPHYQRTTSWPLKCRHRSTPRRGALHRHAQTPANPTVCLSLPPSPPSPRAAQVVVAARRRRSAWYSIRPASRGASWRRGRGVRRSVHHARLPSSSLLLTPRSPLRLRHVTAYANTERVPCPPLHEHGLAARGGPVQRG
ncbi:hypothetical protein DFH09DRAFT_1365911 [Mycena vulgaris]|nr:hypothetical protein DFH09DRAFT_1365911 [Mycena vulgaris]